MNEFVYLRVPFYIPKYWALKGKFDERVSRPFKFYVPKEQTRSS